ncbi:MAG: GFA family protein [Myxococcales bacterium]|nr:GFA family protein [Myxococcales bacterium]
MFEPLHGRCYCGKLRFEVTSEPLETVVCHCPDCRRAIGAQSVAWISVPKTSFDITDGQLKSFSLRAGIERFFCGDCGTSIAWESSEYPDRVDITIGSLDEPARVPPEKAVHRRFRIPWASRI